MNLFAGRLFIIVMMFFFVACDSINPEEPIPSYIKISDFQLVDSPDLNEGSLSNKITDAWIYIDNDPIGVFEIPFTIPVLTEGQHRVKISAGIMQNGIAATRIQYPFYASYDTIITFKAEEIHTINPVFTYHKDAKFGLIEDFEASGLKLERTPASDTILYHIKNNPLVFEGTGMGAGFMSDSKLLFEIRSIDNLNLTKNSPVYLELNYKSELGFSCGVFANEQGQTNQYSTGLAINPNENWNKIYVDLASAVSASQNAFSYKLYIGALKNVDGTSKALYLDNVKVVHW